jgi:hypothetical protein
MQCPISTQNDASNYAYISSDQYSAESLKRIRAGEISQDAERELKRFVRCTEDWITGHPSGSMEFAYHKYLKRNIIIRYLLGLKFALLLPALQCIEAEITGRGCQSANVADRIFKLRRLQLMLDVVRGRKEVNR